MTAFSMTVLSNETPARLSVVLEEPGAPLRLAPMGVSIDERPIVTTAQTTDSEINWPEDGEILAEASTQLGRQVTSVRWVSEGDSPREAIYEVA